MEDHYQFLNTVVTSRAILSLGLACFKWSELDGCTSSAVPLHAEVYNVWLLIQQPFLTDPSSAKFLIKHGFDFNKQYSLGLPYLPPAARTKVREEWYTVSYITLLFIMDPIVWKFMVCVSHRLQCLETLLHKP